MAAATNGVRKVSNKMTKAPSVTPPPLSIAPRGNRSEMPTVNRAPRIDPQNTRDYGKTPPASNPGAGSFAIPGMFK